MICFYINAIPTFAKILTEHDKCCEWVGVEAGGGGGGRYEGGWM